MKYRNFKSFHVGEDIDFSLQYVDGIILTEDASWDNMWSFKFMVDEEYNCFPRS